MRAPQAISTRFKELSTITTVKSQTQVKFGPGYVPFYGEV